jgi:hypothetical protein
MRAKDGCKMVDGQHCDLSMQEYRRLKADRRHQKKPFFSE